MYQRLSVLVLLRLVVQPKLGLLQKTALLFHRNPLCLVGPVCLLSLSSETPKGPPFQPLSRLLNTYVVSFLSESNQHHPLSRLSHKNQGLCAQK